MITKNTTKVSTYSRLIDFMVLSVTFYLSCSILLRLEGGNLTFQALIYASVVLLAIRFGRSLLKDALGSQNRIVGQVLYNAVGLCAGGLILSILSVLVPQLVGPLFSIVVSSIIAFFILGTLSPLLMDRRHT